MDTFLLSGFNYFDLAIGSIVLILGLKGLMSGFIKELFGLAGLVGGVYFGSRYAPQGAKFLDTHFIHIENEQILSLFGFLVVLLVVWMGASILGAIFSKLTSWSGLGFLDRVLGFIVGGGKYFIIFSLIVTALSSITFVNEKMKKYTDNSQLYPYLKETGSYLIQIDPATFGMKEETNTTKNPSSVLKIQKQEVIEEQDIR